MMTKNHCSHGGYIWIFTLTAAFLIVGNCLFAAEQTGASSQAGYIIFPLKHISIEQGKKYLAEVVTGTVTHFPSSSALLVTAEPRELTKARAILDLVDGPEQFVVKAILPVSAARNVPSNEQLSAKLTTSITRGVSIGSFSNPPNPNASTRAIIDIHNDNVVAIAPVGWLDKIVAVISNSQNSGTVAAQDISKARDKQESPAKREASELFEQNAAKFLFAASDGIETDPNTNEAILKQETPESSVADNQQESPSLVDEEQVVNLALAERQKLTVGEFLGLVGPYLQLDFMYEDKDVAGEVTINPHGKFRGPIKIKDLYPLLEEVLKFKNLAMTRGKGNLVTIASAANALDIDPALQEADEGKVKQGDGIIQRVFKLKHIGTTTAQNFLTGMKLTTSITAIPETKTLIITGYAHRMERIEALLNIVDIPGELKKFRFRPLQYTEAGVLAPKIQSLAEQLGTISITIAETSMAESPVQVAPKRANETEAQYQARVRQAQQAQQAAAARQRPMGRLTTTGQEPESALPTVYLDADERTNRILMIGLDKQLDEVEELISTLDVAQQDLRTLELYKINHVDAEQARKQLEELGIISPSLLTSPYSSRLTTGAKPATTPTTPTTTAARTPTSGAATAFGETIKSLTGEPKVVIVEPINSLLVNATAEQHTKIAEILSYVDAETDKQEIPYKVYPLENQSPDHLAEVLKPLIEETVLDKEGKVESVKQKQEEQITIVPDPNTFSLIVSASKKNQEWIKNLIDQLDKRRPQVLIDVTLVEIEESDAFDYDLRLISKFPRFEPGGTLSNKFEHPSILSPFPSERVTEVASSILGEDLKGQGFYADSHIQALLTLMQKKGYGRVLAKPKILVNDNELGHIDTTKTIYVSRSSQSVTTTGEATLSTSYTFDEFPSGIELDITPHISKGELLRLDINMTRSSQIAPEGGIGRNEPPPDKNENNIETTVTVPDKSTIILGGIITVQQLKNNSKIPLLSDIPILGGLFRSINNSSTHSKLYIFVKAEILRPEETVAGLPALEQISERNKSAFEEFEDKFQNYQDWPGIKPKGMDPLKVLDAQ